MNEVYPIKNNSKKISELNGRDVITKHQEYSWIPVAQYDHRIGSYVNIALNVASITGYAMTYSNSYSLIILEDERRRNEELYHPQEWLKLYDVGYNTSYITNSSIANNISSYTFSYSSYVFGWKYLCEGNQKPEIEHPKYKYTELEEYIYGPDGKKILIDE